VPTVPALLTQFSYPAIFGLLLACGLGAPLSEEVILLGTGALVARGACHPAPAVAVAFAGVLAGDLALHGLGRGLGGRALGSRRLARLYTPARRAALEARLRRWGAWAIFGARFVAGARACTFLGCGALGVPRRRFALADALAAAIWVPALVLVAGRGLTRVLDPAMALVKTAALGAALGLVAGLLARKLAGWREVEDAGP
jgi:membrane protein DedA with SNARE-associated domain